MIRNVVGVHLIFAAALVVGFARAQDSVESGGSQSSFAAESAPRPFEVRVVGEGRDMILIPGLMCDGEVWNESVGHFESRFKCHVLSLAGFAGLPPVEGPFLPTMRDAVVDYIRGNGLEMPVIVGHSLGGHLALAIAIEAPKEVGPIVVVDGAPALGELMLPGASAEEIATQSAAMASAIEQSPRFMFGMQNRLVIGQMVHSPETADWISLSAGKSDQKTVARAMRELMTTDLRDEVAGIESPVLLIGAAEHARDEAARAAVRERYEQQVAKIPNHRVVMVHDARHFVMLDKPEFFFDLLDEFLEEVR